MHKTQASAVGAVRPTLDGTVLLYALILFTSAALLFIVQPLVAKLLLPLLGGTPAVWTTCMVFFQAALLAGYLYVHVATRILGVRRQALLHVVLLVVSLAALPIGLPAGWEPPLASNPIPWLTAVLALAVGVPFVLLSANAPMLQKWFSHTAHRGAADPYFLYVPSNTGSLIALGSYPLIVEPTLGLGEQTIVWSVGYVVLAGLVLLCGAQLWRTYVPHGGASAVEATGTAALAADTLAHPTAEVTWALRLRWLVLSFAPSSLLLGVTTYVTTDIAAVPLFWVVPLGLYLLTFILVFARHRLVPHSWMVMLQPFLVLPLVAIMLWGVIGSARLTVALHLGVFFVSAMVCHGELVRHRPAASGLTDFYLWMSIGGVLGGVFNAIIAPLAFNLVIEYSVALTLVCLLRPASDAEGGLRTRVLDGVLPVVLGAVLIWAIVLRSLAEDGVGRTALTAGVALLGLAWAERPVRFGLWIAALLVAAHLYDHRRGDILHVERSFFGVSRIIDLASGFRIYYHGGTVHGAQITEPERRLEPVAYYTRSSPFSDIVEALLGEQAAARNVAIMGLGAGATACYGRPGDSWYFFEIDPLVVKIARDPVYFTFLSECPPEIKVLLGDARHTIRRMPDGLFDLAVADAFSSDAIPVHLVTREAVELYFDKIKPNGVLAFHITNRYVDLEPVLASLTQTLGLAGLLRNDTQVSQEDIRRYFKYGTTWVVLARSEQDLGPLRDRPGWRALRARPGVRHWTDDFSNIVTVLD